MQLYLRFQKKKTAFPGIRSFMMIIIDIVELKRSRCTCWTLMCNLLYV